MIKSLDQKKIFSAPSLWEKKKRSGIDEKIEWNGVFSVLACLGRCLVAIELFFPPLMSIAFKETNEEKGKI